MENTVILSGAAGGLGTTTAHYLARKGNNLIITDVFKPEELLDQLSQYDTKTVAYGLDVTEPNAVVDFVEEISSTSTITGLVTFAGLTMDRTIENMTEQEWDNVLDVNLKGTFLIVQSVAKNMQAEGSIVTIGSVVSKFGNFGQANYVASKAGVEGLTKVAAREFAKIPIRVNCILPGFIESPMTEKIPEHLLEGMIDKIPIGRIGEPTEIASVVDFLLSDKSSYITGSSINVNGGLWMG